MALYINFRDGNVIKVEGDHQAFAQNIHDFVIHKSTPDGSGYDKTIKVNGIGFCGAYCVSEIAGMTIGDTSPFVYPSFPAAQNP